MVVRLCGFAKVVVIKLINIKQNILIPKQKKNKFIVIAIKKKVEVVCCKVTKKKVIQHTCIVGRVLNSRGFPIVNATIKLFNLDKNEISCVNSDEYGYFYINNVCLYEKFKIYAVDKYGNKSNKEEFILFDKCPKSIDLVISVNNNCSRSIIVGDIFDFKTYNPVENITVSLFKKNSICEFELDYIVHTNKYGQFAFRDICKGEYLVKTNSIGYKPKSYSICISKDCQIVNLEIRLCEDEKNQNGTVSGLITDSNNEPVDYADVILYKVNNINSHENLTPIAFTKTNIKGVYLFVNVPKGVYKIKSTKMSDF